MARITLSDLIDSSVLAGDNVATDAGTTITQDANARNQGGEFLRLKFDSGIRSDSRDASKNLSLIRMGNVPNIDGGNNDWMMLGDSRMGWISCNADLDLIGQDIIDVNYVGNWVGLYDTRLVQRRSPADAGSVAAQARLVGIATMNPADVLTDRVVVNNAFPDINTRVMVKNCNLVVGDTNCVDGTGPHVLGLADIITPSVGPTNGAMIYSVSGSLRVWGSSTSEAMRINTKATTQCGLVINGIASSSVNLFSIQTNGVAVFEVSAATISLGEGKNIKPGTTTGSKIGTATSQKLAFWNKTPVVQPTNAISASAFVANSSGVANDTATFGGYTLGQIAAALIQVGILA